MRPSSNPAFTRSPAFSGRGVPSPTVDALEQAYHAPSATSAHTGRMTVDDVVNRTALLLATAFVTGGFTWALGLGGLAFPAAIVGLVLALVSIFKQVTNRAAILAYAAVEGVFLGAISEAFNDYFGGGIVTQAVIGTFGVFAGMLVVYKTGAIRVTPKFTRWLMGAMVGVLVLMLFNLGASLFGFNTGLRDGSPLAIVFSLVVIAVAAFSLLLDFDMADEAIRRGAPAKFAWYIAFGLLVTVVWLYLEILRLLSYFRE